MAISNLDELLAAMTSGAYRLPFNRSSTSNAVVGHEMSLWRGTGFPAQGAVPAAAAICNAATTGAYPLAARAGGQNRIISKVTASMATLGHQLRVEDRLMHMGGLNGTLTTAQNALVDLFANLANSNLDQRKGAADFSEVEWYLEWYTATGATASTPTAQVTFHDGTTGSVNVNVLGSVALPATVAASRRYKLVPTNGKYIRSVETVTLSASTASAGSFGVTAVRNLATCTFLAPAANVPYDYDVWALNSPQIFDNACVTFSQITNTTNTGLLTGSLIQGVN